MRANFREFRLPGTSVNKGMKKGRCPLAPARLVIRCVSLLAHQLVLGLVYQPLLFFPLPFYWWSGLLFFLPRLGDRAYLLHQAQGIGVGPVLHEFAALEAADGDA